MTDFGQRRRQLLKTGQTTLYKTGDDGDLQKGLLRSYTAITTGQHSGTTDITINSKTHALSNEAVMDNSTGLMWARYVPDDDIGPATDGKLFWELWTLATETCTFDSAGKTITADSGSPFSATALCVGRIFVVSGTSHNNGTFTVTAITTSEITVSESVTDEASVSTSFATTDDLIWDFLDQANANSLGGYDDWRVMNRSELGSLVDISVSPSIDATAFPSTPSSWFWTSSTTETPNTSYAWGILFSSGDIRRYIKKTTKYYCRLVRGG